MRFGKKSKPPIIKQMEKLRGRIEKGKSISPINVRTRHEIIVDLFETKLRALNLEPSRASDYIPSARTPLASFLLDHGVDEQTVNTIINELKELKTKADVETIIEAVSEIPGVIFRSEDIKMAKHLALDEWIRLMH